MDTPPPRLNEQSRVVFVTGRLAEVAVREVAKRSADTLGFRYEVAVMPITVAALITPRWLLRHLRVESHVTDIIVPAYCESDVGRLREHFAAAVHLGPSDCRRIDDWLRGKETIVTLDEHHIEIIAEINHAPRLSLDRIVQIADAHAADGADVIDIGADPSSRCTDIADRVQAVRDRGYRVSIDSFDPWEVTQAVKASAELVLSVNSSNREAAVDFGVEVVAIPDTPTDIDSLDHTTRWLDDHGVPHRLDPILEPIGSGLAASIVRYHDVRNRYPDKPMMMGIGNLTELTDADSAAINLVLLGICEELSIQSVLTTQVINWARSAVAECEVARRIVAHSVAAGVPPKRLSDDLVMLRDPKLRHVSDGFLDSLAAQLRDNNYRIYARHDALHLLSASMHLSGTDPFRLFDRLLRQPTADNVDASHAFYLGYELCKASIARQLGKQYEQDRALRFGMLTIEEDLHRIARTSRHRDRDRSKQTGQPYDD